MSQREKSSQGLYMFVFAVLALLLVATIVVDRFDFGTGNVVVAMAIAVAKAALIAMYFMHLRVSATIVRFAAVAGLLWLAVLMILTMADYATRGWNEPGGGELAEKQFPETYDRVEVPDR